MANLFLEIVTPFGRTYQSEITSCTVPGALGQFQILKDHASMLALVNIGLIKIEGTSGKTVYLATSGGFCEVEKNKIRVIVESAELSDKIDVERAKEAKERAEKRLEQKNEDLDYDRVRLALARALNRLKIARNY